jgi:hypothetical protein
VAKFLSGRFHQEVSELRISACSTGLEEVLHGHADLALDTADCLLQGTSELGIWCFVPDRELQLTIRVEHYSLLWLVEWKWNVPGK